MHVMGSTYTLEFYEDADGHEPVLTWLRALSPRRRRAMGVALFEILQHEGPEVVGTTFGQPIGGGIVEFRLDQDASQILARRGRRARPEDDAPATILLGVFCHAHGHRIILLLGGYDKGERPSASHQQAQIEITKARLKDWKVRQTRSRPSGGGKSSTTSDCTEVPTADTLWVTARDGDVILSTTGDGRFSRR